MRGDIDTCNIEIARDRFDEPGLIDDAWNVADRDAEAERPGEIEAVDVAHEVRARSVTRQELERRAEIRMQRARLVLLAGARPIAVAPQSDVLVNASELGLRREIDAIARGRDQMVEAETAAAARPFTRPLAVSARSDSEAFR